MIEKKTKSIVCLLLLASTRLLASDYITSKEYVLFLQENAANDLLSLFDEKMSDSLGSACIQRSGVPGSYCYKTEGSRLKAESAEQSSTSPITFLSWKDARYYCAWKNSHQPSSISYLPCSCDSGAANVDPELRSSQIYFSASSMPSLSMMGPPVETATEAASSIIEEALGLAAVASGVLNEESIRGNNNHDAMSELETPQSSVNGVENEVNNRSVSFLANGTLTQSHIVMDSIHPSSPYPFNSLSDDEIERLEEDCDDKDNGYEMRAVHPPASSSSSSSKNGQASLFTAPAGPSELRKRNITSSYSKQGAHPFSFLSHAHEVVDYAHIFKNENVHSGSEQEHLATEAAPSNARKKKTVEYSPEEQALLTLFQGKIKADMSEEEIQAIRMDVISEKLEPEIVAEVKEDMSKNKNLNPRATSYRAKFDVKIRSNFMLLGLPYTSANSHHSSIFTKIVNTYFSQAEKKLLPKEQALLTLFQGRIKEGMSEEEIQAVRMDVVATQVIPELVAEIKEAMSENKNIDPYNPGYRGKLNEKVYSILSLLKMTPANVEKQYRVIATKILNTYFPKAEKELLPKEQALLTLFKERIKEGMSEEEFQDIRLAVLAEKVEPEIAAEIKEDMSKNKNFNLYDANYRKKFAKKVYDVLRLFGVSAVAAKKQGAPIVTKIVNTHFPKKK